MTQVISAVYAVSENGVIGKNNDLPWHLPAEFQHFKRITLGKPIVMGRLTFESMDKKPLPKRRNIVVTRQQAYEAPGAEVVHSLAEAIALCKEEPEVCLIGGAGLFQEAFEDNWVTQVRQTLIHAEVDGDIYFHLPNEDQWEIIEVDARSADAQNEYAFTIRTLIRKHV